MNSFADLQTHEQRAPKVKPIVWDVSYPRDAIRVISRCECMGACMAQYRQDAEDDLVQSRHCLDRQSSLHEVRKKGKTGLMAVSSRVLAILRSVTVAECLVLFAIVTIVHVREK